MPLMPQVLKDIFDSGRGHFAYERLKELVHGRKPGMRANYTASRYLSPEQMRALEVVNKAKFNDILAMPNAILESSHKAKRLLTEAGYKPDQIRNMDPRSLWEQLTYIADTPIEKQVDPWGAAFGNKNILTSTQTAEKMMRSDPTNYVYDIDNKLKAIDSGRFHGMPLSHKLELIEAGKRIAAGEEVVPNPTLLRYVRGNTAPNRLSQTATPEIERLGRELADELSSKGIPEELVDELRFSEQASNTPLSPMMLGAAGIGTLAAGAYMANKRRTPYPQQPPAPPQPPVIEATPQITYNPF